MRIASTTVVTSFEHDSMITLSVRSICISWRSVSRPSISGIRTSRMMKSGRSPLPILASASLPLGTASTLKPSTSRSVWRYLRMLGSSSTTRTFSLLDIFDSYGAKLKARFSIDSTALLLHVDRQQKRKRAAASHNAINPNFSAMRLDQALGDCETQPHARRGRVDANKLLKNFLVILGGDASACVGH